MSSKSAAPRTYSSPLRSQQREKTRTHLKQSALVLFSSRGYARTQISEIAKKAKVAQGTFYVHFKDKDELAQELLKDFNVGFLAAIQRDLEGADPSKFHELVDKVAGSFLDYWGERRQSIQALVEHFAGAGETDSIHRGFSPELVEFLNLYFANATGDAGTAELVVHGVLGMWLRVGLRYLHESDKTRGQRRATYLRALTRMTQSIVREFVQTKPKGR